ncbi:MAG: HlyD family secretion protein [Hyphomicrobiaceae bacterium]|nr:HlyD family secretion protein [Hyphomicrobiaceae bacterium]
MTHSKKNTRARSRKTAKKPVAAAPAATEAPAPETPAPGWSLRRTLGIALLSVIGPLAATFVGLYIYSAGGRFVSTDNAYIKSEKIAVSADISGRVVNVAIRENQRVEKGALLFRVDPEPFRIALQKTEAQLMLAIQEIEALRAEHKQRLAELTLAEGDIHFYQRQFERQKKLNTRGFASTTNLDTASRNLRNARDKLATIQQDIAQARAKLGGDPNIPTESHPTVLEAQAARDQAALDLRHTEVRAVTSGVITNFELQPGEYIRAGNVVFSLVGDAEVWVQANYKETDLTHVRVGQRANIRIDTYPGVSFTALVTSISPATGAEFALLPPQNATGNWVKVVQRLPVRLQFENSGKGPPLRAGMSVVVDIDTGFQRELPGLAKAALNWARDLI